MIRFLALFVSLLTLSAPAVFAETEESKPVLVELFANQNCAACPQAHKTMREVDASRDDVLILTWTVDYWDYLGEPDPLAMPEAKERQADYAEQMELRAPYTPQSIYNGVKECPGPRKRQVLKNINAISSSPAHALSLSEAAGLVSVLGEAEGAYHLVEVHYASPDSHDTGMVNPVMSMRVLNGMIDAPHACVSYCAILLQSPETGEVAAFWQPDA